MKKSSSVDGIFIKEKHTDKEPKKSIKKTFIWLIVFSITLIIVGVVMILFSDFLLLVKIFGNGKHLVLFQNSAELRPTGGFIGSFAELDTSNFRIKKLDFESNIYKRDNDFTQDNHIVPKDEVLAEFIPQDGLALRDSNWSMDFSEAAQEINWFYEHEDGMQVDYVITLNSEFFKDLLDIIGDIDMVKYDLNISSDNFNEVIQQQVEDTYYESQGNSSVSEPKSILAEMMPIAVSRIKKVKNFHSIYNLVFDSLKNKNIQIYSFNSNTEKQIIQRNWGGILSNTQSDYLSINNANLGANKSSIYIDEQIDYELDSSSSELTGELNYTRVYPEEKCDEDNINFSRILVPSGTILEKAYLNNQDITDQIKLLDENGKTVFRLWTNTSCGQQNSYKIIYKLPPYITKDNYQLTVQKQSGAVNQLLKITHDGIEKYVGTFNSDIELPNY